LRPVAETWMRTREDASLLARYCLVKTEKKKSPRTTSWCPGALDAAETVLVDPFSSICQLQNHSSIFYTH
jgi:hypothetical protein